MEKYVQFLATESHQLIQIMMETQSVSSPDVKPERIN